jgi:hypothetical protein
MPKNEKEGKQLPGNFDLLGTRGGNARLGTLNAFTNCRFGKVRQVDLPCCRGWRPLGSW